MARHDVFVSYATPDRSFADAVVHSIESAGVRCWVTPRDVPPGTDWASSIIEAIDGSEVMVLIMSRAVDASAHVLREVERAVHKGVVIVPIRIEEYTPRGSFEYFLSSVHWLDALSPAKEAALALLVARVRSIVESGPRGADAKRDPSARSTGGGSPGGAVSKRPLGLPMLAGAALLLVLAIGVGVLMLRASPGGRSSGPAGLQQAGSPDLIAAKVKAERLRAKLESARQVTELARSVDEVDAIWETAKRLDKSQASNEALAAYERFSLKAGEILDRQQRLASAPRAPSRAENLSDEEVESRFKTALGHVQKEEWLAAKQILEVLAQSRPGDAKIEPWSNLAMGLCLVEGLGATRDEPKGRELVDKASKSGIAEASWRLAVWHEKGEAGLKPDRALALRYYSEGSDQGDVRASLRAAHMYIQGIGTAPMRPQARAFAEVAAEQGSAEGAYLVSTLTSGAVRVSWLKRAVAERYWLAAGDLGMIYYYGSEGESKHLGEAQRFFTMGAHADDPQSLYGLGMMFYYGDLGRGQQAEGRSLIERAAAAGHSDATSWLKSNN